MDGPDLLSAHSYSILFIILPQRVSFKYYLSIRGGEWYDSLKTF